MSAKPFRVFRVSVVNPATHAITLFEDQAHFCVILW